MRWFQHNTDDRNKLESKLIRSKFGAEGYGIFCSLVEVIGENIEDENVESWGYVHPMHTVETLSEECSVSPEKLREFLSFCNKINVFQKGEKGLFYKTILSRLDNYGARAEREHFKKYEVNTKSVRSKYDIQDSTIQDKTIQNNTRHVARMEYLDSIPDEDLKSITTRFNVNEKEVRSKAESLRLYCERKGKTYKNYKSLLVNAIKQDFKEREETVVGGKYKDL